jgi:hypothetical protein
MPAMTHPRHPRKLTYAKADRALTAIVELIECADTTAADVQNLDRAADIVRAIRDRLTDPNGA